MVVALLPIAYGGSSLIDGYAPMVAWAFTGLVLLGGGTYMLFESDDRWVHALSVLCVLVGLWFIVTLLLGFSLRLGSNA